MKTSEPSGTAAAAVATQEAFLSTDHLQQDLKGRSVSGGVITLSAQAAKFVLTLASTAVLARLLSPSAFGMVAMITTVTGFLSVLKDAGLSMATVQREKISHAQVSNLFWLNAAISAVLGLLVVALAPLISWLYRTPQLVGLTMALSVTFLLDGLTIQHVAILSRQMRFKDLARIEVGSMLFGQCVGIGMAAYGCRAWSLVGAAVATSLSGLGLTWGLSRWRPQMATARTGTRSLVSFGASLTAANCLSYFTRSVDNLLIGRFYGAESVGLYSRATILLRRPLDQLMGPVTSVVLPMLSRLQGDPERYRRVFLQIYESIALIGLPITALVLALARPIVLVLLGPKWELAAGIVAAFSVATLYAPLASAACWLFESQGRGKEWLVSSSILSPLAVASFFVGLPWGAIGVAISYSVSGMLIRLPILFYIAGRSGPVRWKDLWIGLAKNLVSWVVVYGSASLMLRGCISLPPFVQLLICVPVGLGAAVALAVCYPPQRRVALRLWTTFQTMLVHRKTSAQAA
jgi:O-antigen/teichoic acid export membrane protein